MSRAAMLRNGLAALFEDAEAGNAAGLVQLAIVRILLEKGILDRADIAGIARKLTVRAEEVAKGEDGEPGDHWFAADIKEARDGFLQALARDPGIEVVITEPSLDEKLRDPDARARVE